MDVIDRSPRTELFPAPPVDNSQPPTSIPGNDRQAGGSDFFQGLSEATTAPAAAPATPAPPTNGSTSPNAAPLPGPSTNGAVVPPGTKTLPVIPTAADVAAEVLTALDTVDTLLNAETSTPQAVVMPVGPAQQERTVPSGLLPALESGVHRSAEKAALPEEDQDQAQDTAATAVSPVVIAAIFQPPAFTVPEPVAVTPAVPPLAVQTGNEGQPAGPVVPPTPGGIAPPTSAINTAPVTNTAALPATGPIPASDTTSVSQHQSNELPEPDRLPVPALASGNRPTAPAPIAPSTVARSAVKPGAVVEPQAPPVTAAADQSRTALAITRPQPTTNPQPALLPVEPHEITPAPTTPAPVVVTAQIPRNVPRSVAPLPTTAVRTTTPIKSEAAAPTPIPDVTVVAPVPEVATVATVASLVIASEPAPVTESVPEIASHAAPVTAVQVQPTRNEPVVAPTEEPITATQTVAPRRPDRAPGMATSFLQALAKLGPMVSVRAASASRDEEPIPTSNDSAARIATTGDLGARPPALTPTAATIPPLPLAEPTQLVRHLSEAVHTIAETGQQLSLRVTPEKFGPIVVNVRLEDGQLTARVETHSALAHQVLSDSLPQLVESLSARGTTIDRIDVVPIDPRPAESAREDRTPESTPEGAGWGAGTFAGTNSDPQTPDRRRTPVAEPPVQPPREPVSEDTPVTTRPERLQTLNLRV